MQDRVDRLVVALRDGLWLTPARIRAYALIIAAALTLSYAYVVATSHDLIDLTGQPIGTDFTDVYAAGRLALQGHPDKAYDWTVHHAVEKAIFGPQIPYYGWHYPPVFLMLAAPLALLPYIAALIVWQGATLPLYLWTVRRIAGPVPGWFWPALAFPAVFINIGHGHNGFLTAALFGGGLVLLQRRPILAGLLLGALCYKPQFGLMLPLALIAGGHWRAVLAAGASALVLCVLSVALFGIESWSAFFDSLHLTRTVVLEQGSTGWYKIQSVFSAARDWGASIETAYAAQSAATLFAAAGVVALWRSAAGFELKAAALIAGSLIATPYSLDYDMMALGPALAFLAARGLREGFAPYERVLLAAVWVTPLIARTAMKATTIPLGAAATIALFAFCLWQGLAGASQDQAKSRIGPSSGRFA